MITTKEEFLIEHNKLSPENFQATMDTLDNFEADKPGFIKGNDWSIAKIRRPFILWLSSHS